MNKKIALVALVLIALVATACAAYYWIYSNIVHVTVTEYVLTLSAPATVVVDTPITFTGTLMLSDIPVEAASINIYSTDIGGTIIGDPLGTVTTLTDGSFTFDWTPTAAGELYFKAGYEVT